VHDLVPLTALGATEAQIDEFDGLTLREVPGIALASVAMRLGKARGFSRAFKKASGVAPPDAGSSAGDGPITAMWIGPDQWMLEAPSASHEDLAAQLGAVLKDNASVTEQNDGWARFDLEGPNCVSVLERLCATDSATMNAGAVTRTAVEHLGCFLLCRAAQTHYSIFCPRSGAGSLHHAIVTAAVSAL